MNEFPDLPETFTSSSPSLNLSNPSFPRSLMFLALRCDPSSSPPCSTPGSSSFPRGSSDAPPAADLSRECSHSVPCAHRVRSQEGRETLVLRPGKCFLAEECLCSAAVGLTLCTVSPGEAAGALGWESRPCPGALPPGWRLMLCLDHAYVRLDPHGPV